jgi:transposase
MNGTGVDHPGTLRSRSVTWESPHLTLSQTRFGYFLTGPKLGREAAIACCFEAGRDGFWLHRVLSAHGVDTHVVEPTSILVNRRAKRAKIDRLDAEGMLRILAAYLGGDRQVCSMVSVPSSEAEDAKRPHREREHLVARAHSV